MPSRTRLHPLFPTRFKLPAAHLASLLAIAALLGACASGTPRTGEDSALLGSIAQVLDPAESARARQVPVFTTGGSKASWEDLVSAANSAEVVLIGENHGHALGLAAAAALWQDVLDRAPSSPGPTLALEFFERDEQLALDDYLSGVTDEGGFVKAAGRTPGNYPPGHRDMVERAKAAARPVIAANAPRRYVRLARIEGFDRLRALSPEQQRLFRIPESPPEPPYRENFAKVMNLNAGLSPAQLADPAAAAGRERQLDASFRSQQTWDWTMGESVARASGAPVVLVVGRFHVDHNGGTLQAVRALRPGARVLTISFADREPAPGPSLHEDDRNRADFIVYVGESPSPSN